MPTSCCFQIQKGGGYLSSTSVWDKPLPLQIAGVLPNTYLTQLEYSACLWTLEPVGLDTWNEEGGWLPHLSDNLSRLWPDLFILRQMGPHPQLLAQCSLYSRCLINACWGIGPHGSSGNTCEKWREEKQVWWGTLRPLRVSDSLDQPSTELQKKYCMLKRQALRPLVGPKITYWLGTGPEMPGGAE